MTPYATVFRYPGKSFEPEIEDVEEAIQLAKEIINFVLNIYENKGIYCEQGAD